MRQLRGPCKIKRGTGPRRIPGARGTQLRSVRFFRDVCGASGNGRAAEPQANFLQLRQLRRAESGVAFPQVLNGILHPLNLLLFSRAEHTTPMDVAKQVITRPIQV